MSFSDAEINAARALRNAGLPWTPQVGHYVYDESGLIEQPSPFRPGVYFILDLEHFVRRAGSTEELRRRVFWLPDWQQCRMLLRRHGVPAEEISAALTARDAMKNGKELLCMYDILRATLQRRAAQPAAASGDR